MKDQTKAERIALDVSKLLGVNQVTQVSAAPAEAQLGRVLSKIGEGGGGAAPSLAAKLLSKIGEGGA